MIEGIPVIPNLVKAFRRWQKDDGPLMAAAVAYYAALSFFPLLLVLISGAGFALQYTEWGRGAEEQVLTAITNYASPQARDQVATMLQQVRRNAPLGGPAGLLVLTFTAAALFAHFDRAFHRIWNREITTGKGVWEAIKNVLFRRLRAFVMLLLIGVLTLVIFASSMLLSSAKDWSQDLLPYARWVWWVIEIGTSVALNCGVFSLLYKLLPDAPVRWNEAARGALLAAVLWEASRLLLAAFVFGERYTAYGVIGSFIAVMLWIYLAAAIVFLGAEYIQEICEDCDPSESGRD